MMRIRRECRYRRKGWWSSDTYKRRGYRNRKNILEDGFACTPPVNRCYGSFFVGVEQKGYLEGKSSSHDVANMSIIRRS
jgi:hypothetical protein